MCGNADLESAKKSLEGQRHGVVSRLLSFFKTSSPEMASRMTEALYQMVFSKHELALAAKAKLTANLNSPFMIEVRWHKVTRCMDFHQNYHWNSNLVIYIRQLLKHQNRCKSLSDETVNGTRIDYASTLETND